MHSTTEAIGFVGASARAAIYSLARAGFGGWAVDLFNDRDLKRLAPCALCPMEEYPQSLPRLIASFPAGPIAYTGGLENHPEIVSQLAEGRPLWGNPASVLKLVRDPHFLKATLSGLTPVPALVPADERVPSMGRWLKKPLRSSGGRGIRFAESGEFASEGYYLQEYIAGRSLSAIFASQCNKANDAIGTQLLGITEQLIGTSQLHGRPFAYCGNIGPITLTGSIEATLRIVGDALTHSAGLRGIWGLDFMLQEDVIYPVEVNPRYTAAIEVLELSLHLPSLLWHRSSFDSRDEFSSLAIPRAPKSILGKAIYYAPQSTTFPASGPWDSDLDSFEPWRVPGFADIPEPSSAIQPGQPVLSVFASASSPGECLEAIKLRAAELDVIFAEACCDAQ